MVLSVMEKKIAEQGVGWEHRCDFKPDEQGRPYWDGGRWARHEGSEGVCQAGVWGIAFRAGRGPGSIKAGGKKSKGPVGSLCITSPTPAVRKPAV